MSIFNVHAMYYLNMYLKTKMEISAFFYWKIGNLKDAASFIKC